MFLVILRFFEVLFCYILSFLSDLNDVIADITDSTNSFADLADIIDFIVYLVDPTNYIGNLADSTFLFC